MWGPHLGMWFSWSRQRGPPGNEGLPATRVSRQRGPPGNEGLPATRSSRQRGFSGNERFPGNEGPPATRASRQRGPPGNEGLPATRASRQRGLPGNEGLPATSQLEAQGRSLCVALLKEELWESMWPFSGGHILEKGPPPLRARPSPLREGLRGRPLMRHPYGKTLYGEVPYENTRQRGPPSNEGLPATRASATRPMKLYYPKA